MARLGIALSESGPSASMIAVSPQLRLAVSTSMMLLAEKRSSPLMIQIWERKTFAARTNSAAGRACSPSSFTILTSRVISSDFVFSFCKAMSSAPVPLSKLFRVRIWPGLRRGVFRFDLPRSDYLGDLHRERNFRHYVDTSDFFILFSLCVSAYAGKVSGQPVGGGIFAPFLFGLVPLEP